MSAHHPLVNSLLLYVPWLIISIAMLVYLTAAIQQIRIEKQWSKWRIFSFIIGGLLLAIGLTPKFMELAHHDIRVHMAQHLLIGMFAPLGLVLAAPLSLALRMLPTQAARQLMQVLSSPIVRSISHPISALLINMGNMYVLYLTPLYTASLTHPYLHHLLHLHFLLAGYLFCWAIAGPDPAPRRPGMRMRLAVLFLSMATHAYLGKIMYAYHWPKNTPHTSGQIQEAAKLMYYGVDLAEVLLAVAFFAAWFRISRVRIKTKKRSEYVETSPHILPPDQTQKLFGISWAVLLISDC